MTVEPRVATYLRSLPSATGKRAVVTGANTGIGLEVARLLASQGAEVVLTARDLAKGEAARSNVLADVPDADLSVEQLDLASLARRPGGDAWSGARLRPRPAGPIMGRIGGTHRRQLPLKRPWFERPIAHCRDAKHGRA